VGKSTVPAGTARRLEALILESAPAGVEVAWNPEFLREGWAVQDTLAPDRLVIGVNPEGRAEAILRQVYAGLIERDTPLIVVDFATAELVKVAANAFLATKISFINAMAEVCEATGADVKLLSQALSHDTRIGGRFLHAGLGFGGGCLPKDIRAFMARAGELGVDQALSFLREVDAINMRRRTRMVDLARELTGGSFSGGVKVGVLGAAFKPNSDDVRDSPALDVAKAIHLQGAQVCVYDPQANETAARIHPELTYCPSALEAVAGAHIVLHLTEWREFRDMDPAKLSEVVALKRIVDGRNALDADAWRAAGWVYRALGRPQA
jgi:UDPglucose 6-dehydrogenase